MRSPDHDDFLAILVEALDVLEFHGIVVKAAAESLKCSALQLTSF